MIRKDRCTYAIIAKHGRSGMLSNQFAEILAEAGLNPPRTHGAKEDGKGRSAKRQQSELSFHALRHTAVSLLKTAGVSDAVARDIAGHESAAVSARYTHIEAAVKRDALAKSPTSEAIERAQLESERKSSLFLLGCRSCLGCGGGVSPERTCRRIRPSIRFRLGG